MREAIRRLGFTTGLLVLCSAVLLLVDRPGRRPPGPGKPGGIHRVALVQHASIPAADDGVEGVLEALAARGYVPGGRIQVDRFNAEADLGTANAIAKQVTGGTYDLIVSVTTASLQTIANANKTGRRTPHVFGLVTDPYGAGVGIERTNHSVHPPYLTGRGCLQPVAESFRLMRECRPDLRSVGLVWNANEANSQAQTQLARQVCSELGLVLVEANAASSTEVVDAVGSVIARGAEALWISGDVTMAVAADLVLAAARRARIPVFTVMPPTVLKGSMFDLGADYVEVGRDLGRLAADVLDGASVASIPVENRVPEILMYNERVLSELRDRWVIPQSIRLRANGWVRDSETNLPPSLRPRPAGSRSERRGS